jgi:protein-disulfide isomerase
MNGEDLTPAVSASDHVIGSPSAKITLVQYGDYQCPFTIISHWQIELLLKNFRKEFRFVFRHFPKPEKHPFALRAAEATEAAAAQGKFWELHGALLKQKYTLGLEGLREAAAAFKLDLPRFESELREHTHQKKIEEQKAGGVRSGVESTPSYFVNGNFYRGQDDYDSFAKLIHIIVREKS